MTHALTLKVDASVALLQFIGTTKFADLTISSYEGQRIKTRLSEMDYFELKRRLIQHGILASYGDQNQLSQKIGISTKKKYILTQMQLLPEFDNLTLMEKMLDDGHFPFS